MMPTLRIGLLLYPQCMPAGLFAFADLLHGANSRAQQKLFETRFISMEGGNVDCTHGVKLLTSGLLHTNDLDAILLPGMWAESAQDIEEAIKKNALLIVMLKELPKNTSVWSYCTGVCLLAASGRLNYQPATVTWWLMDAMIKNNTKVVWQSEQTCIVNNRTATASGVTGYLPIAQALIEQHVSAEIFRDLTKLMVLPRPERTHQVFHSLHLIEQPEKIWRILHALIQRLPATEITVQRLASELNMSERTLARKVQTLTGCGVSTYARKIKLNQVSERLIMTNAQASTISSELGFSSDSSMRRMFKELTTLTPTQYRQLFGRV